MKRIIVLLSVSLLAALSSFGQTPPPNDNLTNATVLTGTDVTFSGSLAGATIEDSTNSDGGDPEYTTGSIWWSWTAPATTVLNIQLLPPQNVNPLGYTDLLNVYSCSNGVTSPAELPAPLGTWVLWNAPQQYLYVLIPVTAGSNYLIELVGNNTNVTHTFRLIATNAPMIFKQPVPRTVYSNGSAFFYVVGGGQQPLSYQWFLNGTSLPGQTFPMLSFDNINVSNVGSYSVLVSNASGSTMSAPATLAISPSIIPPVLRPVSAHSNLLTFSLTGELGRAYLIQSSTNLADWAPENSFVVAPPTGFPWLGNYVFTTNAALMLNVPKNSASKYYRAYIYKAPDPESEICINHLQMIHAAKLLCRRDFPTERDPYDPELEPYIPNFSNIYCPDDRYAYFDTSYWINDIDAAPICQVEFTHMMQGCP